MILVIDNYDSFTWNLVHLIGATGEEVVVERNDALSAGDAIARGPRGIVLSPGPCTPDEAGICLDLVPAAMQAGIPLLGVCLGHQSIVQAAGGRIIRAGRLMHGRTSEIAVIRDDPLFAGLPHSFTATRYHSLVAEEQSLPGVIDVFARAADDNEIMACRWRDAPVWGVQFHPESIASEYGAQMIANFMAALPAGAAAA